MKSGDMMKENVYWKLFKSTFALSAFTFGGGFVIIPLMKQKFVETLGWIDEKEMLDLVSIAQSSPGALTVNASIIVGYKVKGILGAFIATLGSVLPPLIIISIISYFYNTFITNPIIIKLLIAMNIGIAAILIDVVYELASTVIKDFKVYAGVMILLTFIAAYFKLNIILIIFIGGLSGFLYFMKFYKKNRFKEDI